MFVRIRGPIKSLLINIRQIEKVESVGDEEIVVETKSTRTIISGTVHSFANTLSDIMLTGKIMIYHPPESK